MAKQLQKLSPEELERQYRERTLVMCKPECVRLGYFGEIFARISRLHYKIVLLRMFQFHEAGVLDFYGSVIDMWEPREDILKIFLKMTEAPSIALVVEGPNAVRAMRKLAGGSPILELEDGELELRGYKAQFRPMLAPIGTVRGDLSALDIGIPDTELIPVPNFMHASETSEEYERELEVLKRHGYIGEGDLFPYGMPQWDAIYGQGRGQWPLAF